MAERKIVSGLDTDYIISQAIPGNRKPQRILQAYDPTDNEHSEVGTNRSSEIEPESAVPPVSESEEPMRENETPPTEPRRRRGKVQTEPQEDFSTLFLHEAAITARSGKTVYITQKHHDQITKILQVIAKNEVSMFSYIYNVLEHHFSSFQDDMNSLYDKKLERKVC